MGVAYTSRRIVEAELRYMYEQIEKQALAIVWACEKFDFYRWIVNSRLKQIDYKPYIAVSRHEDLSMEMFIQRTEETLLHIILID